MYIINNGVHNFGLITSINNHVIFILILIQTNRKNKYQVKT